MTRRNVIQRICTPIAAAIAWPLFARTANTPAAKTRDVIRQADLESVYEDMRAIELKILGFRRRILAGAAIEPGGMTAEFDPFGFTPEEEPPSPSGSASTRMASRSIRSRFRS